MARQRSIHPEIWTSDAVGRLPLPARLLWIGIFSTADDEGRLKGSPEHLRATVFPHDRLSIPKIELWLALVEAEGMIRRYSVDGRQFIAVINFRRYQRPKYPTPSKLPAPPSEGTSASSW